MTVTGTPPKRSYDPQELSKKLVLVAKTPDEQKLLGFILSVFLKGGAMRLEAEGVSATWVAEAGIVLESTGDPT